MPARKGLALNKRHATKEERAARESLEATVMPRTRIEVKPPAALKGRKIAAATWTRLINLYNETEGTLITAFDADLLIKYCLAEDELVELGALRAEIKQAWETHSKWLKRVKPSADNLKDYLNALAQASALLQRFQGMDGRMDNKRKMIHDLAKSLYLTPRSRAGAAPEEKLPTEPKSEMDDLLD